MMIVVPVEQNLRAKGQNMGGAGGSRWLREGGDAKDPAVSDGINSDINGNNSSMHLMQIKRRTKIVRIYDKHFQKIRT